MEYRVEIKKSIKEINKYEWDKFAEHSSVFSEYEWYNIYEGWLSDIQYYIEIYHLDKIVEILPCYIITDNRTHDWHNIYKLFQVSDDFKWERSCFDDESNIKNAVFPNLLVTSPNGYISEILTKCGVDSQVYRLIIDSLDSICAAHDVNMQCFLWVQYRQADLIKFLEESGYAKIFVGADQFNLINTFNDFSDYLDMLPSSIKRKVNIQKEIKCFEESGHYIQEVDKINDVIDIIVDMEWSQQNKYGIEVKKSEIHRQFYLLGKAFSDSIKIFVIKNENAEIVGFSIGFEKENSFYLKFIGFNYKMTEGTYSYFNIFYYIIKKYIGTNIKVLEYGGGSYRAKLLRGCGSEPLYAFFRYIGSYNEEVKEYFECIKDYSEKKESYYNRLADRYIVNIKG